MKLRYLIICDDNGRKTEPMLQYYDEEFHSWEYVEIVEIKDWEDDRHERQP